MKKLFIFVGILAVGSISFADGLSGDTVGSALTNLSSLQSSLGYALTPESETGKVGYLDSDKTGKTVCAQLGEAIGHAFAVQSEIRFYTPSLGDNTTNGGFLALQLNDVINVLTDSRNGYCVEDSKKLADVKQDIYKAQGLAQRLTTSLEKVRKQ
jgi:hypothetical protein